MKGSWAYAEGGMGAVSNAIADAALEVNIFILVSISY
jgi:hypothetical protein